MVQYSNLGLFLALFDVPLRWINVLWSAGFETVDDIPIIPVHLWLWKTSIVFDCGKTSIVFFCLVTYCMFWCEKHELYSFVWWLVLVASLTVKKNINCMFWGLFGDLSLLHLYVKINDCIILLHWKGINSFKLRNDNTFSVKQDILVQNQSKKKYIYIWKYKKHQLYSSVWWLVVISCFDGYEVKSSNKSNTCISYQTQVEKELDRFMSERNERSSY